MTADEEAGPLQLDNNKNHEKLLLDTAHRMSDKGDNEKLVVDKDIESHGKAPEAGVFGVHVDSLTQMNAASTQINLTPCARL